MQVESAMTMFIKVQKSFLVIRISIVVRCGEGKGGRPPFKHMFHFPK
jgi:hypothetical protein